MVRRPRLGYASRRSQYEPFFRPTGDRTLMARRTLDREPNWRNGSLNMVFRIAAPVMLMAMLFTACGGGGGGTPPDATPPTITSFTATPSTINAGQSSTLGWIVAGALSLGLDGGVGDVTGLASRQVAPGTTTTYTLTATNAAGTATSSVTVNVLVPSSVTRLIPPALTDPAIATYLDSHVAITPDPAVASRHGLFLYLVGTGGKPVNQQLILGTGAARGYHAIGLMYPNTPSVGSLCSNSADADAFWNVRGEIITGQDLSSLVAIPATECVEHRLVALLTYLAATYPTEGWDEFIAAGQPDWTRITVGGHSQGGGHAAVIGKLHAVARVVCLSSPADWRNIPDAPATWYARPGATPADRVFGFSHLQDELVPWSQVTLIWTELGLDAFGGSVSVDGAAPPYAGSHRLTTDITHATAPLYPSPFHSATVVDLVTPKLGDGSPAYRPVWVHLCFP
jgi:hypothetical protein